MDNRHSSGYGGQGRTSALRNSRSPPQKEHAAAVIRTSSRGKPTSPLRAKISAPRTSSANQMNESELYEISRQKALRRQLEEKERELNHLQQNPRDRLRGSATG